MQKGWGGTREDTPEIGILTTGEEKVPNWMWVVEMEVGGKAPLWNILTNRKICLCPPLVEGVVPVW